MEHFLSQCAAAFTAQYPLIISAMLGGVLGSLSHCSIMCSPAVTAHMFALRETRRPASLMGFYHAGRISSYGLLGVVSVYAGQWLFGSAFIAISHRILLIAGAIFLISALMPRKTHACCNERTQRLQRWVDRLSWPALHYYLRGALMGFMPCGLLLSMLLMVSTLSSPWYAALVMMVFGAATTPALHAAARIALSVGNRYPRFGVQMGRVAMAGNGLFLCGIGLNLVSVS